MSFQERLDWIKALHRQSTLGNWTYTRDGVGHRVLSTAVMYQKGETPVFEHVRGGKDPDLQFVVAAHEMMPELVARLDAAEKFISVVKDEVGCLSEAYRYTDALRHARDEYDKAVEAATPVAL